MKTVSGFFLTPISRSIFLKAPLVISLIRIACRTTRQGGAKRVARSARAERVQAVMMALGAVAVVEEIVHVSVRVAPLAVERFRVAIRVAEVGWIAPVAPLAGQVVRVAQACEPDLLVAQKSAAE